MPLPRPAPGVVVRYAYLWADKANAGHREGRKGRPCVVAAERQGDGRVRVRVGLRRAAAGGVPQL